MRVKTLLRRTPLTLIVILAGITPFSDFIFHSPSKISTQASSAMLAGNAADLSSQEQARAELPVRLKIPSIKVDALVEYVGLAQDGAMDVPKERANVAWFELGQRPGENGSAVIAGHYGWKNNEESVFDDLHQLRKGDRIYVEDEKGATVTFVVRESRRYDPQADASAVFGSYDGKAHLNLITCEGKWDEASQTYSKRLVVFADKEE